MKKQTFLITLLTLGALGLSACTSGDKSQIEVQNQNDDVVLSPPPEPVLAPAYQPGPQITYSGDSSVEIFDPNQNYMPPMDNSMMNYGQPVQTSDSSVTVYSLDNQVPAGIVPPAPAYNAAGYAPMNSGMNPYMNSRTSASASSENQIFFKHGSSRLGSGDMQKLSSTAEQAKFAPVNRVTVAGHASQPTQAGSQTVEGHILNLKESMNRSFAVSKTLMKKGVPAEKIKTVSWGSTQPTGDEAQDRRVDIIMGDQ